MSGPAIDVATRALGDEAWIAATRDRLAAAADRLDAVLRGGGLDIVGGTSLFRLTEHASAPAVFQALGADGIFVRHFPDRPNWLRFGLPPDDLGASRLAEILDGERAKGSGPPSPPSAS